MNPSDSTLSKCLKRYEEGLSKMSDEKNKLDWKRMRATTLLFRPESNSQMRKRILESVHHVSPDGDNVMTDELF